MTLALRPRLAMTALLAVLAGCQLPFCPPVAERNDWSPRVIDPPATADASHRQRLEPTQPPETQLAQPLEVCQLVSEPGERSAINAPRQREAVRTARYHENDPATGEAPAVEEVPTPAADTALTAEQPWSLEQVEQRALAGNPAVAQAWARLRTLDGRYWQAGLPPNPTVGYQAEEIGDEGTAGLQGGFVSQRFIRGGKLQLDQAVVSSELLQAEQELAAVQMRVRTDARMAYYRILAAQLKLDVVGELVTVSEQAVGASRKLWEAEDIPRVGLLQAEVESLTARNTLRAAQQEAAAAWRHLAALLGETNLSPRRLSGSLDDAATELEWEEQLQRLLAESPELAVAAAALEKAKWQLDRAAVEAIPDVEVELSVFRNNASGDTVAGVQVGLPLPLWNKNQGGIQAAYGEIAEAQRNLQRVESDLQRRLAAAFEQYARARFQVRNYSEQIIPKASQSLELVTGGYEQGEVGYLDMLTSQRTYFELRLAYVEALRELWESRLRIEGLLLEDSLSGT